VVVSGSLEVLVEPVDRDLGVDAEVVVSIEAAGGALDPVQLFVLDGQGVIIDWTSSGRVMVSSCTWATSVGTVTALTYSSGDRSAR
jgi:hypothetical protein